MKSDLIERARNDKDSEVLYDYLIWLEDELLERYDDIAYSDLRERYFIESGFYEQG